MAAFRSIRQLLQLPEIMADILRAELQKTVKQWKEAYHAFPLDKKLINDLKAQWEQLYQVLQGQPAVTFLVKGEEVVEILQRLDHRTEQLQLQMLPLVASFDPFEVPQSEVSGSTHQGQAG